MLFSKLLIMGDSMQTVQEKHNAYLYMTHNILNLMSLAKYKFSEYFEFLMFIGNIQY